MKIKFFVVMVLVLVVGFVTLSSGTVTTFKTGPFTGSVDLGTSCNDTNISKPVQDELLSGQSYTRYIVLMCGVTIELNKFDIDLTESFITQLVTTTLLILVV